ncbi:MAG: hypothetical protein KC609_21355, partial [Myxococcales bacterium]|nr:hypothetical protein [Myxococcales bacterium]
MGCHSFRVAIAASLLVLFSACLPERIKPRDAGLSGDSSSTADTVVADAPGPDSNDVATLDTKLDSSQPDDSLAGDAKEPGLDGVSDSDQPDVLADIDDTNSEDSLGADTDLVELDQGGDALSDDTAGPDGNDAVGSDGEDSYIAPDVVVGLAKRTVLDNEYRGLVGEIATVGDKLFYRTEIFADVFELREVTWTSPTPSPTVLAPDPPNSNLSVKDISVWPDAIVVSGALETKGIEEVWSFDLTNTTYVKRKLSPTVTDRTSVEVRTIGRVLDSKDPSKGLAYFVGNFADDDVFDVFVGDPTSDLPLSPLPRPTTALPYSPFAIGALGCSDILIWDTQNLKMFVSNGTDTPTTVVLPAGFEAFEFTANMSVLGPQFVYDYDHDYLDCYFPVVAEQPVPPSLETLWLNFESGQT